MIRHTGDDCECLGHPHKCYDHPEGCSCQGNTVAARLAAFKEALALMEAIFNEAYGREGAALQEAIQAIERRIAELEEGNKPDPITQMLFGNKKP